MKSLLPIFFLILSSNNCFSSIFKHKIDRDINKVLKHKSISLKRSDLYLAENLISLYKIINSGYFNNKMVNKIYSSVLKSEAFNIFLPWVSDLKKLQNLNSTTELAQFCESINTLKNHSVAIIDTLNQSKMIACTARFTNVAIKSFQTSKSLSKSSHHFINNNTELFLTSENLENTAYLLSVLQKKSQYDHLILSQAFSAHYIAQKTVPPKSLLSVMDISPDLTKFIQIHGFGHNTTRAIYYRELDNLGSVLYDEANNEMPPEKVQKLARQLVNYFDLNLEHLPSNRSENRMMSVAKSLSRRKYYKSAKLLFSSLIKNDRSLKEEAIFEYLWTDISEDKYDRALEVVDSFKLTDNLSKLEDSQLLFWVGQILIQNDDVRSKKVFETIINKDPMSYYAVMAAKSLQDKYNMTPDKIFEKYLSENQIEQSLAVESLGTKSLNSLIRLKAWSKLDNNFFTSLESTDFINVYSGEFSKTSQENKRGIATLIVSSIFNETNNYLASFKNIYRGINDKNIELNFSILKNLFPQPFLGHIKSLTKSYDPIIALSLIRQESGFDPKARSMVGARGLMQIMPATARRFKRRLKTHQLYNPYTNLQIGTKYFDKLLNKYDQNLVFALSAYNAGETRVRRWKSKYFTNGSMLKNIEKIPFDETRKYVKLIFRNMFFYKLLTTKPETTDSPENNKIFGIFLGFNN